MLSSLALILLLAPQADAARKDLPITLPAGWESKRQEGATVLAPKDLPAGKVYNVVLPDLTRKVGSVDGLVDVAKAMLGEVAAFKQVGETGKSKSEGDWDYAVLGGTLGKDGRELLAQAVALKKGEDEGLILVVSDSVETLQRYSDALTTMVRSLGAPKAAPPAPAATTVDLKHTAPEGWTVKTLEAGVLYGLAKNDFYEKYDFRILVLPSQPLQGSLRKAFVEMWDLHVKTNFETKIVPLPLVRRLNSGMAVAFDQDNAAKNKQGVQHHAGLYLLARGNRFVPIVAFFFGMGNTDAVDKALLQIFDAAEIPGAGAGRVPLVDAAELAGTWTESSHVFANYVTSAGAYAGDASIATVSYLTLNADGTVKATFMAVTAKTRLKEVDEGKWRVEDNELFMDVGKGAEAKTKRYRIFGVGSDEKGGSFLVISDYPNTDQQASLPYPRRSFNGQWFKKTK